MYSEDEKYPFRVVLTNEDMPHKLEMWRWCVEQWGRPRYGHPSNWTNENNEYGYSFKFDNINDRLLFLMKWSC